MSTRANVIITTKDETLIFYRHSDGYPECAGKDLAEFVQPYLTGAMRDSVMQSAGWLIILGHAEYASGQSTLAPTSDKFSGWKCGAYEPTTCLHGDVEYVYIIHLDDKTLECRVPKGKFWDDPKLANTKQLYSSTFADAVNQPGLQRA